MNNNKKQQYYEEYFSSDTTETRCLAKGNIFPYTRWSQISWIGESLCSIKKLILL